MTIFERRLRNDAELYKAYCDYIDEFIDSDQKAALTSDDPMLIYRSQGSVRRLKRMKVIRQDV